MPMTKPSYTNYKALINGDFLNTRLVKVLVILVKYILVKGTIHCIIGENGVSNLTLQQHYKGVIQASK